MSAYEIVHGPPVRHELRRPDGTVLLAWLGDDVSVNVTFVGRVEHWRAGELVAVREDVHWVES